MRYEALWLGWEPRGLAIVRWITSLPRSPNLRIQMLPTAKRTQYVYGDESGGFNNEPYFLLGIVLTYAPEVHDAVIEALRDKHGYSRQFEYKKTDRLKRGLCEDVIDYFVECDDLEFQGLLIPTRLYDLRHYRKDYDDSARTPQIVSYNYRYKQIIRNNTSLRDELVVILDERTTAKDDNLPQYLQRQIPNVKSVQLVNSQKHNLVQLADLLTGSIFGDVTNNTHPVKRSLIDHLKRRLQVSRLTDRPFRLSRKFRVYEWRPPRK